MPQIDPQQFIETQRLDWNRVAPAWDKWDVLIDRNMTFINYRLIGDARLRPGEQVLDLGCGTGYPALLAAQAVGGNGRVLGLDLAEGMLAVARRRARALGLSNVEFLAGDVTRLSSEPATFDAVISRFCLMFLPDISKAAGEIARVLKPGGYLAAAVWSAPENNPFISIPMNVLKAYLTLPPPDPEQPGIFRLARPGDLLGMAERAGLRGLTDEEWIGESVYDSADEYFSSLMEMAAPLQPLFAELSSEQKKQAESAIKRAAESYRTGSGVALPMAIRIVVARKPF
ncbi:MAG: methyltransferase domain-containing protein [Nitrospirae bacterium]|nr:methyltransferase domain-containing protein [Nitrospirota bacterium]